MVYEPTSVQFSLARLFLIPKHIGIKILRVHHRNKKEVTKDSDLFFDKIINELGLIFELILLVRES